MNLKQFLISILVTSITIETMQASHGYAEFRPTSPAPRRSPNLEKGSNSRTGTPTSQRSSFERSHSNSFSSDASLNEYIADISHKQLSQKNNLFESSPARYNSSQKQSPTGVTQLPEIMELQRSGNLDLMSQPQGINRTLSFDRENSELFLPELSAKEKKRQEKRLKKEQNARKASQAARRSPEIKDQIMENQRKWLEKNNGENYVELATINPEFDTYSNFLREQAMNSPEPSTNIQTAELQPTPPVMARPTTGSPRNRPSFLGRQTRVIDSPTNLDYAPSYLG